MHDADPTKFCNHRQAPLEEARVVILPLPFEATVSYMKGAAEGPEKIIAASHQLEDWEEETCWEPTNELPVHSLDPLYHQAGESPESYLARVGAAARTASHAFLVAIGGEHSVTGPLVSARLQKGDTVVVVDAHPDLRESYEGTPLSHACAMRRVAESGMRIVQIGTGCDTAEEAQYAAANPDFHRFWAREAATPEGFARILGALSGLTGRVYLSIDLDGLCTSVMPGVGTPVPGGLTWHKTVDILRALAQNPNITLVGMDVVEIRPLADSELSEFTAAKLIQKGLAFFLRK